MIKQYFLMKSFLDRGEEFSGPLHISCIWRALLSLSMYENHAACSTFDAYLCLCRRWLLRPAWSLHNSTFMARASTACEGCRIVRMAFKMVPSNTEIFIVLLVKSCSDFQVYTPLANTIKIMLKEFTFCMSLTYTWTRAFPYSEDCYAVCCTWRFSVSFHYIGA